MKQGIKLTSYTLTALLIVFGILGAVTALATVYYYEIIARGALGFVVLYLLFSNRPFLDRNSSMETLLSRPNKIKDFFSAFSGALIGCWAGALIVEMVFFYLRK